MLLPLYEFALNSTKSAATRFTPAYVLYAREPYLPLEYAVHSITDCPVQAISDRVAGMQATVDLVHSAVACATEAMSVQANKH